jgi:hypothetical protein
MYYIVFHNTFDLNNIVNSNLQGLTKAYYSTGSEEGVLLTDLSFFFWTMLMFREYNSYHITAFMLLVSTYRFLNLGQQPPSWPWPPHSRGF